MDRVYTNKPHQVKLFNQWAQKNDIYYKLDNYGGDFLRLVKPDGSETGAVYGQILLKPFRYRRYPYVDTFKYLDKKGDGSLLITNDERTEWVLDCVDGTMSNTTCEYCGGSGMYSCSECDRSGSVECWDCNGDGEIKCRKCAGSGWEDEEKKEECPFCDGDGKIECNRCDGEGSVTCDECEGRGEWRCQECS